MCTLKYFCHVFAFFLLSLGVINSNTTISRVLIIFAKFEMLVIGFKALDNGQNT